MHRIPAYATEGASQTAFFLMYASEMHPQAYAPHTRIRYRMRITDAAQLLKLKTVTFTYAFSYIVYSVSYAVTMLYSDIYDSPPVFQVSKASQV